MRTAKTDQTGRMPRLILVYAGRTATLLVLSCRGSYVDFDFTKEVQYCVYFIRRHMRNVRSGNMKLKSLKACLKSTLG